MARVKKVVGYSLAEEHVNKVLDLAAAYGVNKSMIVARIIEQYEDDGKLLSPKEE